MNFDILSTDEHSHCDFSAILKFDAWENAQQAVRIIVNKPYASNGYLSDGDSGAFRVGTYVMLNVYSESVYLNLIQELRDASPEVQPALHPEPSGGIQDTMYGILADLTPDQETKAMSRRIDTLAAKFIKENIPGAIYLDHETYDDEMARWIEAWFAYDGKRFHIDFCIKDGREWLNLWSTSAPEYFNVDVSVVTPDTIKHAIASMDPDGHFQPDEKVPSSASEEIFDILESDIETMHDFDNMHKALDGLVAEYLAANFPEAVFTGTSIKIEEDRKILKIAFSYGCDRFEIRFKSWNSRLRSVWLGLDDSSRKVVDHWKLKELADDLLKEPAQELSADERIAALEKEVASLKDTVAKLLKK